MFYGINISCSPSTIGISNYSSQKGEFSKKYFWLENRFLRWGI